jgi:hypothetical protein
MLRNGKSNVIEDLEEQFNEIIYLILTENAQEKLLRHGTKNKVDELFEVGQRSHALLDNALLEDEMLIITENDIIEFKDKQTMY